MATDLNGNTLASGDIVLVPCLVRSIAPGNDLYNLNLETLHPCHPSPHATTLALNAKQVTLCDPAALNVSLGTTTAPADAKAEAAARVKAASEAKAAKEAKEAREAREA